VIYIYEAFKQKSTLSINDKVDPEKEDACPDYDDRLDGCYPVNVPLLKNHP